jgi:hypothetical protein
MGLWGANSPTLPINMEGLRIAFCESVDCDFDVAGEIEDIEGQLPGFTAYAAKARDDFRKNLLVKDQGVSR